MNNSVVKWAHPEDNEFPEEFMVFKLTGGNFEVLHRKSYQSRAKCTAAMIADALQAMGDGLPDLEIPVFIGDVPWRSPSYNQKNILAYSTANTVECKNIVPIPDFIFRGWPEAGIENYDEITRQCVEKGNEAPEHDDVFWIGSPLTNQLRQEAVSRFSNFKGFNLRPMSWMGSVIVGTTSASDYVSIPDHARHSVLCDLPAGGYSGRFKLLLWTGRPVIVFRSPYEEFFFPHLKDHHNCIFVDSLDGLADAGHKLLHDKSLSEFIGKNGRILAEKYLTYDNAISYLSNIIRSIYMA